MEVTFLVGVGAMQGLPYSLQTPLTPKFPPAYPLRTPDQTLIARLLTEPEILGDRMAVGNILILFGGRFFNLESRPKLSYS